MTTCQTAEEQFSAYWEGELAEPQKARIESHLSSCDACQTAYREFVRTLELIRGLPALEAPADFTSSVLARVRSGEQPAGEFLWERLRNVLSDWSESPAFRPALATAAVAVVAIAAVTTLPRFMETADDLSAPTTVAQDVESDRATEGVDAADRIEEREGAPVEDEALGSLARGETAKEDEAAAGLAMREDGTGEKKAATNAMEGRERAMASEPQSAPSGAVAVGDEDTSPVVPDSLFDHRYDFEFALDPVHLRNLPGDSSLTPARPMPEMMPEGKPASIHF